MYNKIINYNIQYKADRTSLFCESGITVKVKIPTIRIYL